MSKYFNIVTGSRSFYAAMLPGEFKITIIVVTGLIVLHYDVLSISVRDYLPIVAFIRANDTYTDVAVMIECTISYVSETSNCSDSMIFL